jgi:hypothetical protein
LVDEDDETVFIGEDFGDAVAEPDVFGTLIEVRFGALCASIRASVPSSQYYHINEELGIRN